MTQALTNCIPYSTLNFFKKVSNFLKLFDKTSKMLTGLKFSFLFLLLENTSCIGHLKIGVALVIHSGRREI